MDLKKDINLYKNKIYTIATNIYSNLTRKNNFNENNILLFDTNIIDINNGINIQKCKKYNYNYFIIENLYIIFNNDKNKNKFIYKTKILIFNYIYIIKLNIKFSNLKNHYLKNLYFYKIIKNNKYNKNIKLLYCNNNINIYHNYYNIYKNYNLEIKKCNTCYNLYNIFRYKYNYIYNYNYKYEKLYNLKVYYGKTKYKKILFFKSILKNYNNKILYII